MGAERTGEEKEESREEGTDRREVERLICIYALVCFCACMYV